MEKLEKKADIAAYIRKALKKSFPSTKFVVRKTTFLGCCMRLVVVWDDITLVGDVERFISLVAKEFKEKEGLQTLPIGLYLRKIEETKKLKGKKLGFFIGNLAYSEDNYKTIN